MNKLWKDVASAMTTFSQVTVHAFKPKAAIAPQWPPIMNTLRQMYHDMHIGSAYFRIVKVRDKFIEKYDEFMCFGNVG